MSDAAKCPPFEEATDRFRTFLLGNGWPGNIEWVKGPGDPERLDPAQAKGDYEFARQNGLGVCLDAIRIIRGSTVAVVLRPCDADKAERLMYPSDGGLKLSIATTSDE